MYLGDIPDYLSNQKSPSNNRNDYINLNGESFFQSPDYPMTLKGGARIQLFLSNSQKEKDLISTYSDSLIQEIKTKINNTL